MGILGFAAADLLPPLLLVRDSRTSPLRLSAAGPGDCSVVPGLHTVECQQQSMPAAIEVAAIAVAGITHSTLTGAHVAVALLISKGRLPHTIYSCDRSRIQQGICPAYMRSSSISTHLTTQMLCLSCNVLLLTLLSGVGVAGPSACLAPGLPTALASRGGAPGLPGVAVPLLAGPGDISDAPPLLPTMDCLLELADLAALAARAAAFSSTSAANTSSTSNCGKTRQ